MKKIFKLLFTTMTIIIAVSCSTIDEPKTQTESNIEDSHYIGLNQALENAENGFQTMFKQTRSGKEVTSIETFRQHTRAEENVDSLYGFYLVNYDSGFALLSADDRRPEVLAISDESSLHLQDTLSNKALAVYLDAITSASPEDYNQIGITLPDSIGTIEPVDPSDATKEKLLYKTVTPKIEGLAKNLSQDYPYNQYCYTNGELAKVGCVPVSIAICCSYYKFPTSYSNYTISYNDYVREYARFLEVLGRPEYSYVNYGVDYTDCMTDYIGRTLQKLGYYYETMEYWDSTEVILPILMGQLAIGAGYNENHLHTWVMDGAKIYAIYNGSPLNSDSEIESYEYYVHCIWGVGGTANGYYIYVEDKFGGSTSMKDANVTGSMPKFSNLRVCPIPSPNN